MRKIIILIAIFLTGLSIWALFAFYVQYNSKSNAQTPVNYKTGFSGGTSSTLTYVSNNMSSIKFMIDTYAKQGYRVKFIECQSVSNSYPSSTGTEYYKEIKGDIILVMEK